MTSNNTDLVSKYGVNVAARILYLHGEVDEGMAGYILRWMDEFERLDAEAPITIQINSTGGSVFDGLAIADRIILCKVPVIGLATGSCMSMATVVLAVCDKRVATKHTSFLLHEGNQMVEGTPSDTVKWVNFLKKQDDRVNDIYASAMNKTRSQVKRMIQGDLLWTANDALKHGLIQEMWG